MIEIHADSLWTVAALRGASSWERRAEQIAKHSGVCNVMRADDRLVIFLADDLGKVCRKTYKPREWTVIKGA